MQLTRPPRSLCSQQIQIDNHTSDFTKAFVDLRRRFTESGVVAIELKLTCLVDISEPVGLLNLVQSSGELDSSRASLASKLAFLCMFLKPCRTRHAAGRITFSLPLLCQHYKKN
ncbi:hypothetical protein BD309DRAFT_961925 [Dichomitus squalens]|nr:hypothetical protein BD309DRAFT_961925 [Dichomitus squalens]